MNKRLLIVLALAFVLRIWNLQQHPAGFTPDEASFGYDAYSILKTGKDQWGSAFPLVLKSFGDSKLPLYTYLDVPFVAIFGLSEFSVRLPNALMGSLAVLATYLMVLEVLKNRRVALLSSFLLAVSPWHIPMSRGAFEANLTTFLMPLGIYLFYKGLKNKKMLIVSSLVFGLNMFSYHSARLVTPLIVGFLILSFYKAKKSSLKVFGGVYGVFFLGSALAMLGGGASRAVTSGIFNPTAGWESVATERFNAVLLGLADIVSRAFNNRFLEVFDRFLGSYLSYFSPQFLITEGPREFTYGMVPGIGVIYFVELLFLVGFLVLVNHRRVWSKYSLIVFWLFVAAVPAALAKGPGHAANRAVIMLPALSIISASGAVWIYKKLTNKWIKKVYILASVAILVFGFVRFFEDYLYKQPVGASGAMVYGARELVEYLDQVEGNYENIVVSRAISEPHIYVAFYTLMDPDKYQLQANEWGFDSTGLDWVDQMGEYSLGKYTFRSINYREDLLLENTLLVGKPEDFPEEVEPIYVVKNVDRTDAFWVVDPQEEYLADEI